MQGYFYAPIYSLGNRYFRKNNLTSNFIPIPFDELSYFVAIF